MDCSTAARPWRSLMKVRRAPPRSCFSCSFLLQAARRPSKNRSRDLTLLLGQSTGCFAQTDRQFCVRRAPIEKSGKKPPLSQASSPVLCQRERASGVMSGYRLRHRIRNDAATYEVLPPKRSIARAYGCRHRLDAVLQHDRPRTVRHHSVEFYPCIDPFIPSNGSLRNQMAGGW
jgi:hypothetical protein